MAIEDLFDLLDIFAVGLTNCKLSNAFMAASSDKDFVQIFFNLFVFLIVSQCHLSLESVNAYDATFCFCYSFHGGLKLQKKMVTRLSWLSKQGSSYFYKHLHDKVLWPIGGVVCIYTFQLNSTDVIDVSRLKS